MSEEKPTVDVNVVQVVASALAAVSSAVLLSTVGVAGTIVGAAVGSVIATVGGAVYSYSLQASRDRVAAAAQLAASARIRRSGQDRQDTRQLPAEEQLERPTEEDGRTPWRQTLAGLPWKRVAVVTAGVFVAAMAVIVSFELVAGKPLSAVTHGTTGESSRTSIPGLGSSAKPTQTPTDEPTGSESPTGSATASETPDSSSSASPTATPSETASPTPEESPSASPSTSPEPGDASPPAEDPSPVG